MAAALLLAGLLGPDPAEAAIRVAAGDRLRVSVVEAPDIDRETEVNVDGRIMLPGLGSLDVAGLELDEVRARIAEALARADIAKAPRVLVEIAAYRPFYVGGAVADPGAVPFSPGLTVRHALILAGGVSQLREAEALTSADLLELQARWQTNRYELLALDATISRLEAELTDAPAPDFRDLEPDALDPDATARLLDLNRGLFQDALAERREQKEHYSAGLALADLEIDVLSRQNEIAEKGQEAHRAQLEQARTLNRKGLLPLPRVQELERQSSYMSSSMLEGQAYAARARQNRETLRYNRDTALSNRRVDIQGDLAGAVTERMRLEAESGVLATALVAAGVSGLTGAAGLAPPDPEITLYRKADGETRAKPAALDTPILPGDIIDIVIPIAGRQG